VASDCNDDRVRRPSRCHIAGQGWGVSLVEPKRSLGNGANVADCSYIIAAKVINVNLGRGCSVICLRKDLVDLGMRLFTDGSQGLAGRRPWLVPHLLHRRLPIICFLVPVLAGGAFAALSPTIVTAQALLLIGTATGQTTNPDAPSIGVLVERALLDAVSRRNGPSSLDPGRDVTVAPTDVQHVAMLGYRAESAEAATAGLQAILDGYAGVLRGPPMEAGLTKALAAADGELAATRTRIAAPDWIEELHAASQRVAELTNRLDQAQQQAAAAQAGLAAATQLLVAQPGSVRGFVETAEAGRSDADVTMLLGLLVDREHLMMQYAADSPPVREINRKIDTARTTIAANSQARRATVRDVRNPSLDVLNQRLATARIAEQEASGKVSEILRQLAAAKSRSVELLAAEPQVLGLQREQDRLARAYRQAALAPVRDLQIGVLQAPFVATVDRMAAWAFGVGGLVLAVVLMMVCRLMQAALIRRLLPVDHVTLRPLMIPTQPPSLIDSFANQDLAAIRQTAYVGHTR
jgi:hypothetical protein